MARVDGLLQQVVLRLLVLALGAGVVTVGLLGHFRANPRHALECRLADGTALVASFSTRARRWPHFGVKTLRLAQRPEHVATFRLVSSSPHELEDAEDYDLYLADGDPYLLRRTDETPEPRSLGTEVTGEWYELLPLEPTEAGGGVADRLLLVRAAANQLAALAYAPEVQLRAPPRGE
jgi:hypothetical protein